MSRPAPAAAGAAHQPGPPPVELRLAGLVGEALAGAAGEDAAVTGIDLSCPPKLGEIRAFVELASRTRDRAVWRGLQERVARHPAIARAVVVPPLLLVTLAPGALEEVVGAAAGSDPLRTLRPAAPGVVVVFCSPNTNKPLHVGHLRACFLGMSLSRLYEATGTEVARSQMLSNFGIHMCQALAAYDGQSTPEQAGLKGDHFVGDLYRRYHTAAAAVGDTGCDGFTCRAAQDGGPCIRCRASQLLRAMAAGDPGLRAANARLGEWAIAGILATQARVGTHHHTGLRESETLPLATATLEAAVADGTCLRRPDGSTYIPVRSTGEAELTLLRRDGTSLVFGMLVGIYLHRESLYPGWQCLELTGEQWRAGRTAMYEVLRRLGRGDLSDHTEGVFFGMVGIGGAPMQSRSGNVALADDLLDRMERRVAGWEGAPGQLRADGVGRARLAAALLKLHILSFPRRESFDFDEEATWAAATERLTRIHRAWDWASRDHSGFGAGPQEGAAAALRPLALTLAQEARTAGRALADRDPAVLVRYLDQLAERCLQAGRRRAVPSPALAAAVVTVLGRELGFLGIEAADIGLGPVGA